MSNIIAFSRPARRAATVVADRSPPAAPMTETHKNQRFRLDRRRVWRDAGQLTSYWRARLDWHSALGIAQSHGIPDAALFSAANDERRSELVDKWRAALAEQLLTPSPDLGAVSWKRAQVRAGDFQYIGVSRERVERTIERDVEWLAAHPARRSMAARCPMIGEMPVLHDLAEK